jgi:two-component sensor histidine kinase
VPELEEKFNARLMSLARAHSMIAQGGWSQTCLRGLADSVLEPYSERISIDGGDVGINAENGLALSLAFHELATNAAKYGAHSGSEGKVSVSWSVARQGEQAILTLDWIESGGPRIAPPANPGFGSKLVTTVVERQLNGTVVADFNEAGLRVRLAFPLI